MPRYLTKVLPKDLSVHALLAADMVLNHQANFRQYLAWNAVVPTWDDIQLSMPLTWPAALQARLPCAATQLLDKQRSKFERDWGAVSGSFPLPAIQGGPSTGESMVNAACSRDEYLYAWLLVNTRTFYFVTPKTEKLHKDDHMVLQPVADLFNHTDQGGCNVTFDYDGSFSFRTTRPYEKGEEVHISYGRHSNDFLLVEYGFVLPSNKWDEVRLDDALLPSLTKAQKEALDDVGFLGNYVLDRETVCHRTQVAARLLLTQRRSTRYGGLLSSMEDWRRFVSGLDDGDRSQRRVDEILVALLKDYLGVITKARRQVESITLQDENDKGTDEKTDKSKTKMNESRRELLLRRWSQIEELVGDTVKRLQ